MPPNIWYYRAGNCATSCPRLSNRIEFDPVRTIPDFTHQEITLEPAVLKKASVFARFPLGALD